MTEDTMRKKPKQARSQQRVDQLLDAAALVFAEAGYDAATTNAIATRAGVPIGSLYQFFSNKEALLEALMMRYTEQMASLLATNLSLQTDQPLPEMLRQFMIAFAEFEASHVAFRTLFMTVGLPIKDTIHGETVQHVESMLAARFPRLSVERHHLTAQVSVAIVKGLMPLANPPENVPAERIVAEIVTALLGYIRAVLLQEGEPLPPDLV